MKRLALAVGLALTACSVQPGGDPCLVSGGFACPGCPPGYSDDVLIYKSISTSSAICVLPCNVDSDCRPGCLCGPTEAHRDAGSRPDGYAQFHNYCFRPGPYGNFEFDCHKQ